MTQLDDKSPGVKYDSGKIRFDLIPVWPMQQLATVYTMGAAKYADHNWRKGIAWSRVYAALQRHLNSFWGGEDLDRESGLCHLAHAAWGCLTLLEFTKTATQHDDRYGNQARDDLLPVGSPLPAIIGLPDEAAQPVSRWPPGPLVFGKIVRPVDRVEVSRTPQEGIHGIVT